MEIWRSIPFAPTYKASSYGNIKGIYGKLMRPSENYAGYLVLDLHKKQYRVNRIICRTFHGEPPSIEHHAAHKDSDKRNNNEANLYWATPLENAADLSLTGHNQGSNSCASILKEADVIEIRKLYQEGYRLVDIASFYPQVEYVNISAIVHRRSWRHL